MTKEDKILIHAILGKMNYYETMNILSRTFEGGKKLEQKEREVLIVYSMLDRELNEEVEDD